MKACSNKLLQCRTKYYTGKWIFCDIEIIPTSAISHSAFRVVASSFYRYVTIQQRIINDINWKVS